MSFTTNHPAGMNGNAFGGTITLMSSVVGINNVEMSQLSVYPNPATDILYIQSLMAVQSIVVYDIHGRIVIQAENTTSVSVSNLPNGIYLVKVKTASDETIQQVVKK